jgi:tellurite resistance protein TerC
MRVEGDLTIMSNLTILWIIFALLVILILVLDLGFFNRKTHAVEVKEALKLSFLWVSLAMLFNACIYFLLGPAPALKFLTGYLIEESLSIDNLFVFLIIFSYFGIPSKYQHKVLFWGILGAMIMRALFIFAGIAVINRFHWAIYAFGAFLVFTGIKMFSQQDKEINPEHNLVLRIFRRFFPVKTDCECDSFFVRENGRYIATSLFVVLLAVETTDIVFAVDSIPAILGITNDPFIVYTSNIFAILGLRAIFFALAGIMKMFRYLSYGLAVILVFIGVKMLVSGYYEMPIGMALGVVAGVLLVSVAASVLFPAQPGADTSV